MGKYDYDMVIVGGGVGGMVTASGLAQLGAEVCLLEKRENKLGGDCLYYGCVPTKTLINCGRVAENIDTSDEFGIRSELSGVDFNQVHRRVESVIEQLGEHDSAQRFRELGVEVKFTTGQFVSPHEFELESGATLTGRRFLIATGSSPVVPPIDGLEEVNYQTNETIVELDELPESLAVVGGGPIGLEFGQAFSRLGCDVQVIEALPEILNKEEPELAALAHEYLEAEGLKIRTDTKVEAVSPTDSGVRLNLAGADAPAAVETETMLLAVGRRPNVEGLNLEAAGVETHKPGIKVNDRMQTTQRHIFAVGDVTGLYPFTHVAEYQAGIVVGNIMAGPVPFYTRRADYSVVPWCTYIEPELARVGLTEAEAEEKYGAAKIRVDRLELANQDRPVVDGKDRGRLKLIYREKLFGLELVGAHILGSRAGELIHEYVLAMKNGLGPGDISGSMHVYPTYSLSVKRATDQYFSDTLFSGLLPQIVRRYLEWTR